MCKQSILGRLSPPTHSGYEATFPHSPLLFLSQKYSYCGLTCSQEEHILVETLTAVLTSDNTDCVYHHLRNTAAEHALVVTCYVDTQGKKVQHNH